MLVSVTLLFNKLLYFSVDKPHYLCHWRYHSLNSTDWNRSLEMSLKRMKFRLNLLF